MSKKKEITLQEVGVEYGNIENKLNRLRKALVEQLYTAFESQDIQLGFPIQHRTKTLQSLTEKIKSNRFVPKASITEFQDLVGLRIILLFKTDVEKLKSILENKLKVVKQYDTVDRLKESEFGYSSFHYIVEIPDEWLTVPTFEGLGEVKAEIQVRTMSQHTWAEASRILQYKREGSVPKQLLRAIGRVSALLETVDLEFERLLTEKERYQIALTSTEINLDQKLNVDLVKLVADENLPITHKEGNEYFEELLLELESCGVITVGQLKNLINKNLSKALDDEKMQMDNIRQDNTLHSIINMDRIAKGVHYNHIGLLRSMMYIEFPIEMKIIQKKKWSVE